MKLVHVDISKQMNFEQSSNFILAIENSQEFYRLSSQLISQCRGEQGDFAIYDGQLLDIPKTCIVIHDFYSDWFASKKTTSALQSQIIDLLKNNDFIEDFLILTSKRSNFNILKN